MFELKPLIPVFGLLWLGILLYYAWLEKIRGVLAIGVIFLVFLLFFESWMMAKEEMKLREIVGERY